MVYPHQGVGVGFRLRKISEVSPILLRTNGKSNGNYDVTPFSKSHYSGSMLSVAG